MNVSDAKSGITNFQKLPACAEAHARDHVLRKGLLTPHLRGVRGSRAYSARGKSTQQRNEGREIRTPNLLIWSQTRCRCAIPPSATMGFVIPSVAKRPSMDMGLGVSIRFTVACE